ncbi:hypothetical protein D1872_294480 [compost metagenome]
MPVSTAKEKDSSFTFAPEIVAVSSSKARLYNGRLKIIKYTSPVSSTAAINSSWVSFTATMEPNK